MAFWFDPVPFFIIYWWTIRGTIRYDVFEARTNNINFFFLADTAGAEYGAGIVKANI